MLSQVKIGPSPRVRRRQLENAPNIEVLADYLRELCDSPPGAEFNFSWFSKEEIYTISVSYSQNEHVANWKLYRGNKQKNSLIWEHLTNDIPMLNNLIASETGTQRQATDADLIFMSRDGGPNERDSNYIVRHLADLYQAAKSEQAPALVPSTSMNGRASGLPLKASIFDGPPINACQAVDLTHGRNLVRTLQSNDLGIFSYSAFLFLLEQEYFKAQAEAKPFTVVLMKVVASSRDQAAITIDQVRDRLQDLKMSLRKIDVLAAYESGNFALLLPETDSAGGKLLAQKSGRILSKGSRGNSESGLVAAFGIATLGGTQSLRTLPQVLSCAERALAIAERTKDHVFAYDDLAEFSARSQDMSQLVLPSKVIDLESMRQLSTRLISEDGILSDPAWLMLLEREYHRSRRQRKPLLGVAFSIGCAHEGGFANGVSVPQSLKRETLQRILQLQHKSDIIGKLSQEIYLLISPFSSIESVQELSRKIEGALDGWEPSNGLERRGFEISSAALAIREHSALPDALMFYPA